MRPGPGADHIKDIRRLLFRSGEVGTFILADTLEHVADPWRAIREVHRCLRRGVAICTSVMCFPIHGHPNDYWRFTPEAFRMYSRHFHALDFLCGPPEFPHTISGIGAGNEYDKRQSDRLARW